MARITHESNLIVVPFTKYRFLKHQLARELNYDLHNSNWAELIFCNPI